MIPYFILLEFLILIVPCGWMACDATMKRKWAWAAIGMGLLIFCCAMIVAQLYVLLHGVRT